MNTTAQAIGAAIHQRRTRYDQSGWPLWLVVVVIPLLLPYTALSIGGGSAIRLIFPGYIFVCALWIIGWRKDIYLPFVLAVFAFAPFLRRVADFHYGFALTNPILVAPYFGLLPTLPSFFRQLTGRGTGPVWPFAIMVICIGVGEFNAMLQTPSVSNVFEAIRWSLPLSLCTFIIEHSAMADMIRRRFIHAFLIVLPVLTLYGIYQYAYAPPWDDAWMLNIGSTSFGEPEPFKIRVFSMMNSPYSVAIYAVMGMIILSAEGLLGLLESALAIGLVAVTLVRTAWIGLLVGLLVQFIRGTPGTKLVLIAGAGAITFGCIALLESPLIPPDIANIVTERLSTFTALGTDVSANARQGVYSSFFDRLADAPFGEGFGVNLSTATMAQKRNLEAIDSGVLETFLTFGVILGTAYFVALAALVAEAFRASRLLAGRLAGFFGVVCCSIAICPLGVTQVGEVGVLEWSVFGILVATAYSREAERTR
ncbi:MAG TPA: hypothetical protein VGC09_17700 [Rhodopila sp.]